MFEDRQKVLFCHKSVCFFTSTEEEFYLFFAPKFHRICLYLSELCSFLLSSFAGDSDLVFAFLKLVLLRH